MAAEFIHKTTRSRGLALNSEPDSNLLYEYWFFPCVKWRYLFGEWSFDQANTCVSYRVVPPLCIKPFAVLLGQKMQLHFPPASDVNSRISHLQTGRVLRKAEWPYGEQEVHMFSSNRCLSLHLHILGRPFLLSFCMSRLFGYKNWSLVLPAVSCSLPESHVIRFFPLLPRSLDLSSFCFKLWNACNAIVELNKHCITFGDIACRKNGPAHKLIVDYIALKKDRLCTYCLLERRLQEF